MPDRLEQEEVREEESGQVKLMSAYRKTNEDK